MSAPTADIPENITGLSGLINKKKAKKNVNLTNIEKEMQRNFKNTREASNAVDEYKEEMKKITEETGLDFGETWDADDLMGDDGDKIPSFDDEDIFGEGFESKKDPLNKKYKHDIGYGNSGGSRRRGNVSNKDDFWDSGSDAENSDEDLFDFNDTPARGNPSRPRRNGHGGYGGGQSRRNNEPNRFRHNDQERNRYTRDQIRQKNIDAFMDEIADSDEEGDSDDMFEQVKEDDQKHHLLNQIDTLRDILEEDDVDISHIPEVDGQSDLKEIRTAHKMLVTKNDSRRCSGMAEEGVLMIAYALEDIFDGKRVFFGRFKPNLQGWHTTAQNKLRRMRFETSTIVSSALQSYGVGNMGRVGMELIPSMIIYSKRKQASSTEPDLVDTAEFNEAIRDIHDG